MEIFTSSGDELHWEPRGLTNLGNTCFINVIVQNLCRTDSFLVYLRRERDKWGGRLGPVTHALLECFECLRKKSQKNSKNAKAKNKRIKGNQGGVVNPIAVLLEMRKKYPYLNHGLQQDAQELCLNLLDAVHQELLKNSDDDDAKMSFVDHVFGSRIINTITCDTCHIRHHTMSRTVFIRTPVPEPEQQEVHVSSGPRSSRSKKSNLRNKSRRQRIAERQAAERLEQLRLQEEKREKKKIQVAAAAVAAKEKHVPTDAEQRIDPGLLVGPSGAPHFRTDALVVPDNWAPQRQQSTTRKKKHKNRNKIKKRKKKKRTPEMERAHRARRCVQWLKNEDLATKARILDFIATNAPPAFISQHKLPTGDAIRRCKRFKREELCALATAIIFIPKQPTIVSTASAPPSASPPSALQPSKAGGDTDTHSSTVKGRSYQPEAENDDTKADAVPKGDGDAHDSTSTDEDDSEDDESARLSSRTKLRDRMVGRKRALEKAANPDDPFVPPREQPKAAPRTLERCLQRFCRKTRLLKDQGNGFMCKTCQERIEHLSVAGWHTLARGGKRRPQRRVVKFSNATMQQFIRRVPQMLIVNLARLIQTPEGTVKNDYHIAFGETLDLRPFVMKRRGEPDPGPLLYKLTGVIEHTGSLEDGHYITFVRERVPQEGDGDDVGADASSAWYRINDSEYSRTTLGNVLGRQAYMLFYQLHGPGQRYKWYEDDDVIKREYMFL